MKYLEWKKKYKENDKEKIDITEMDTYRIYFITTHCNMPSVYEQKQTKYNKPKNVSQTPFYI